MNYLTLWISLMAGGVIYYGSKVALGFDHAWEDLAASAYWTGFALLCAHWFLKP